VILLDASALVSFFVADANSDAVNAYFSEVKPVAGVNDFAAAEFASAVSLRLRREQIALPEAVEVLDIFDEWTARNAKIVPLAP
jgi:predicted nucleic acid-binding protein